MKTHNLIIRFPTKEKMDEWFEEAKDPLIGNIPTEAKLRKKDSLDKIDQRTSWILSNEK